MFSDIEGLPSLAMSTTDGDMGAITSVDFSAFTGPVSVTKDELTAILADATDSTCQSDQGSVYVVSEDFAITSNVMICNVAIIAPKIDVGSGVTLRDIALIAGDPGNTNNELVVGADISLGSDYNIERVLLASRNRIQLGGSGIMGDPLSCDSAYSPPSVQLFALENVNVGSVTTIYNADIAANGDVNMGSNLAVNLNGTGTTIQANGNIFVASDGTFGACAQDILADANSEDEAESEFTALRVVN